MPHRIGLWLCSALYSAVMRFRNGLYARGIWKAYVADRKVICVGNLVMGGSGKTPCVMYLTQLLQQKYRLAVLSRGYGRTTRGFRIATHQDTACTLGDEPLQMYHRLNPQDKTTIAVAESRVQGIQKLIALDPNIEVILMDDGFQHRSVQPHLNILLTTYHQPFFADRVWPAGRLREPPRGASRADLIVVTQCPQDMSAHLQQAFRHYMHQHTQLDLPVCFAGIRYETPVCIHTQEARTLGKNVLLLTGIADTRAIVGHVKQHCHCIQHLAFADHHRFTVRDIQQVLSIFDHMPYTDRCILTTEKDRARLIHPTLLAMLKDISVFYLPMHMSWIVGEEVLHRYIEKTLGKS